MIYNDDKNNNMIGSINMEITYVCVYIYIYIYSVLCYVTLCYMMLHCTTSLTASACSPEVSCCMATLFSTRRLPPWSCQGGSSNRNDNKNMFNNNDNNNNNDNSSN